ncbi:MAG TPA: hypothetical protein VFW29_04800 [Solirubrobacteraceae bacterium]|nr:hypothetical protein [Solirubrobacteraceae bacterium]
MTVDPLTPTVGALAVTLGTFVVVVAGAMVGVVAVTVGVFSGTFAVGTVTGGGVGVVTETGGVGTGRVGAGTVTVGTVTVGTVTVGVVIGTSGRPRAAAGMAMAPIDDAARQPARRVAIRPFRG